MSKPTRAQVWTFAYEGDPGPDENRVEMAPIELPAPKALTLQFFSTLVPSPIVNEATPPVVVPKTWTAVAWPGGVSDPGDDGLALEFPAFPAETTRILISRKTLDSVMQWDDAEPVLNSSSHLIITWDSTVSEAPNYVDYALVDFDIFAGFPGFYRLDVSAVGSRLDSPWVLGETVHVGFQMPQPPIEHVPNAAIRARVEYSAGKAENVTFECDWSGQLQLMASRVVLSRVTYRPDATLPFFHRPVKVSAIASVGRLRSAMSPTLTVPAEAVPSSAARTLEIPAFAERLSLIALYGNDGSPGDAPLDRLFVEFVGDASEDTLMRIDVLSAREALFGAGLPLPAGVRAVRLRNESFDFSVRLGAIWHLGL